MTDAHKQSLESLIADPIAIAIVWTIEDVQEVRPDLSKEECWRVLTEVHRNHDATIGINWDVLECVACELFGFPQQEAST